MKRLVFAAFVCAASATFFNVTDATAHPTTSTCSEQWQSSFAISNASDNFRESFLTWSKLDSTGKVVSCPAGDGQAPGCADQGCSSEYPWPGYSSPCWFWRHRCGEHYIRMEDDAGEGHTWFEEWGAESIPLKFCDPGDGKGIGFVGGNSPYQTPNCQNWTQGNLKWVSPHMAGTSLVLWVEHTSNHQFVVFDLNALQVFPQAGVDASVDVALKVGSGPNDWWITTVAPNNPSTDGSNNGYQVWDTSSWGYEVERVVFTGSSARPELGYLSYDTPSTAGWWSQTDTLLPVADVYTRDGASANTNFGTATTLQAKATTVTGNRRNSFLRFDLSAAKNTVTSATLRIWGASSAHAKTHSVYLLSLDDWGFVETDVTWNNQPRLFDLRASKSIGTTAGWQEFDVTDVVAGIKIDGYLNSVAFGLATAVSSTDSASTFDSREGTHPPQLVLVSQ